MKPVSADEVDRMLDTIEREGVNLTTWEEQFVEDMLAKRARHSTLTEAQAAVVERIYVDRTP
jgi:hypothetical protein